MTSRRAGVGNSASPSSLPSWAIKVVNHNPPSLSSSEEHAMTDTRQSETLLRLESAHIWQSRIHRAQRTAWAATVAEVLSPKLSKTLETSTCSLNEYYSIDPTITANDNKDEADHEWDDLVPTTLLTPSPTCKLDRHALSEAVWDHYHLNDHKSSSRASSCAIWLPRFLPTLSATLHLIARQCWRQESDPHLQQVARALLLQGGRGTTSSFRDALLWWARHTQACDSLVLILEDPGGFSQKRVRNEFVAVLQEWRTDYGLPVEWIVIGRLLPLSCRIDRLRIRHCPISQDTWMATFWNEVVAEQEAETKTKTKTKTSTSTSTSTYNDDNRAPSSSTVVPLPLTSMSQLTHLLDGYLYDHRSCSMLGQQLMMEVMAFYQASPGSFVWDTLETRPSFTSWFATYGTAKEWLSPRSGAVKLADFQTCHGRIHKQLRWWWDWQRRLIPLLLVVQMTATATTTRLFGEAPSLEQGSNNDDDNVDDAVTLRLWKALAELHSLTTFRSLCDAGADSPAATGLATDLAPILLPPVMGRYLDRVMVGPTGRRKVNKTNSIKKVSSSPTTPSGTTTTASGSKEAPFSTPPPFTQGQRQAITLFHEWMMLVGHQTNNATAPLTTSSDDRIAMGLVHMLEDLYQLSIRDMEELLDEWKRTNPLLLVRPNYTPPKRKQPQQQPQQQQQQQQHYHRRNLVDGLPSPGAKELYGLLQERLSIPREEWLYEYGGNVQDFCQGVWTLVLSGLIQAKAKRSGGTGGGGSDSGIVYEKVSVVWC